MEGNDKKSSSKRTRALNIHYLFLVDQAEEGNVIIEHCQADDIMIKISTRSHFKAKSSTCLVTQSSDVPGLNEKGCLCMAVEQAART